MDDVFDVFGDDDEVAAATVEPWTAEPSWLTTS